MLACVFLRRSESIRVLQAVLHFVFERINSSGTRLSSQEIRNCIAEGKFIRLTAELNENEFWRKLYGKPSLRAKDQELITRVLEFLERGNTYERPMATFLTEFAKDMSTASPQNLAVLRKSFEETAELCWNALNGSAFRPVRAINAAVLDAIMSEVARRLRQAGPAPSAGALKHAYERLIESEDFREGWERATADEDVVKKRISLARNAFSNIYLHIRDTPPVGTYVLNMFCMRGARLWGSRLHRACVV